MSDDKNYPVKAMDADTLARRRDHAQRNPWGNTAEMVGHIDWLEAQRNTVVNAVAKLWGEAQLRDMHDDYPVWAILEFCQKTMDAYDAEATHGADDNS